MNITEQFAAADSVRKLLEENNNLLKAAAAELAFTRSILELVKPAQHDLMLIFPNYDLQRRMEKKGFDDRKAVTPATAMNFAIEGISDLLGDRQPLSKPSI